VVDFGTCNRILTEVIDTNLVEDEPYYSPLASLMDPGMLSLMLLSLLVGMIVDILTVTYLSKEAAVAEFGSNIPAWIVAPAHMVDIVGQISAEVVIGIGQMGELVTDNSVPAVVLA